MNFLPLCTAMVWPMNSGKIVERRDQVLTTFLSLAAFRTSTFLIRCSSTKGPFFVDRAITRSSLNPAYFWRRLTIIASVRLLLRVLYPRVGWPHGVTG